MCTLQCVTRAASLSVVVGLAGCTAKSVARPASGSLRPRQRMRRPWVALGTLAAGPGDHMATFWLWCRPIQARAVRLRARKQTALSGGDLAPRRALKRDQLLAHIHINRVSRPAAAPAQRAAHQLVLSPCAGSASSPTRAGAPRKPSSVHSSRQRGGWANSDRRRARRSSARPRRARACTGAAPLRRTSAAARRAARWQP